MTDTQKQYNILVVEDDFFIRNSLVDLLETCGYNVSEAENGVQGYKSIEESTPDIVISDVMMPKMDGFELLKKIRDNAKIQWVPVIMVTAKVDLESKLQGLEMGADDYITKPFEFRELQLKIRRLLRKEKRFNEQLELEPNEQAISSSDQIFLKKLKFILEENIGDSKLPVEFIANQLYMSPSTLQRRVKKLTGKPTVQLIKEYKLKKAKEMIRANYGTLSEIAYKAGFNSLAYFSTSYKDFFGKTPKEHLPK